MKFETKFNIDDNVLTIERSTMKVRSFEIQGILLFQKEDGRTTVLYEDNAGKNTDEKDCYSCVDDMLSRMGVNDMKNETIRFGK